MKILITGSNGFIGKNLSHSLRKEKHIVYEYDKLSTEDDLNNYCKNADFIFHFAGATRPKKVSDFYEGNAELTTKICNILRHYNKKTPIFFSSSIQVDLDNDYGKSKKRGENVLISHSSINNSKVYIYRFTNLFGRWARPNHSSVVATWCYNHIRGLDLRVDDPKVNITLCYIEDVIKSFLTTMKSLPEDNFIDVVPKYEINLLKLKNLIEGIGNKTIIEDSFNDDFVEKMTNTYNSYKKEYQHEKL